MIDYRQRNELLKKIGFKNYRHYLDSRLWKIIHGEVLDRDGRRCRVRKCGKRGNTVHHINYTPATLLGSNPAGLVTVCEKCYKEIEFQNGKKRPLKESQKRTLELVIGLDMIPGKSSPKIGYWFRNQIQTNKKTRDRILKQCTGMTLETITQ